MRIEIEQMDGGASQIALLIKSYCIKYTKFNVVVMCLPAEFSKTMRMFTIFDFLSTLKVGVCYVYCCWLLWLLME